jgi:ComF family protein
MNGRYLQELRIGISHLLYPRLCEGCNRPLLASEKVLCINCGLQLPETSYHDLENNETALRFSGRIPFIHATSYAYFTADGLLQHLLHRLKYNDKKEIGQYLGMKLGLAIQNGLQAIDNSSSFPIDMIFPVPLHKDKIAKRGYNQSMLIAEGISDVLRIPVNDKLLVRVRNTESQTNKTRAERVNNVNEAFDIVDKRELMGKHILLCDDVLTTGATLEACAMAIMKEKTVKISLATVGIAFS